MSGIVKWFVAGAIGGAVGAAVWAAITYFANAELGIIAWGIGFVVGMAVRAASPGDEGSTPGAVAVGIAVLSILAGKWAGAYAIVHSKLAIPSGGFTYTDKDIVVGFADDIVKEYKENNKQLTWPGGSEPDEPDAIEQYPTDVAKEAQKRFDALTPQEVQARKDDYKRTMAAISSSMRSGLTLDIFKRSFGVFDILWFFLAIGTAYRVASGRSRG